MLKFREQFQKGSSESKPAKGTSISKEVAVDKSANPPSDPPTVFNKEAFKCPPPCFASGNISTNKSTKNKPPKAKPSQLKPKNVPRFANSAPIKPDPPVSNNAQNIQNRKNSKKSRRFTRVIDGSAEPTLATVSQKEKVAQISFFARSTGMFFTSPMRSRNAYNVRSNPLTEELKLKAFEAFEAFEKMETLGIGAL